MKKTVQAVLILMMIVFVTGCRGEQPNREALRLSGIEKMNTGNYPGAVEDFEAALQASRGRVSEFELDVLKYRAEAEYMTGDYLAAAHTYDVLLQVDKVCAEYLYRNALVKALAQDTEGALAAYQEGVETEKKTPLEGGFGRREVLTVIGEACIKAGRQQDADQIYAQAVQDGVAEPSLFNDMGLSLFSQAKANPDKAEQKALYEHALESFRQAASTGESSDPAVQSAKFNQAVVYEYLGQYRKALELFEAYAAEYGMESAVQKEITFLKTR